MFAGTRPIGRCQHGACASRTTPVTSARRALSCSASSNGNGKLTGVRRLAKAPTVTYRSGLLDGLDPGAAHVQRTTNRLNPGAAACSLSACSLSKRDIKGSDVAQLLQAARPVPATGQPEPQHRQQYGYWRTMPGFEHAIKLDLAIQRSIVVVACFANVEVYGSGDSSSEGDEPPPGIPDMDWNWLHGTVRRSRREGSARSLVGFARATGDNALVATIYDLSVHPELRGIGIGQRLTKLMVQQLQSKGIYDIGLVAPPQGQAFFRRKCSFEEDREGSTFMTFLGTDRPQQAPLPPAALLEDSSLMRSWERAARSESLRQCLRGVLGAVSSSSSNGNGSSVDGRSPAGKGSSSSACSGGVIVGGSSGIGYLQEAPPSARSLHKPQQQAQTQAARDAASSTMYEI